MGGSCFDETTRRPEIPRRDASSLVRNPAARLPGRCGIKAGRELTGTRGRVSVVDEQTGQLLGRRRGSASWCGRARPSARKFDALQLLQWPGLLDLRGEAEKPTAGVGSDAVSAGGTFPAPIGHTSHAVLRWSSWFRVPLTRTRSLPSYILRSTGCSLRLPAVLRPHQTQLGRFR